VTPAPKAICPIWRRFLTEAKGGNDDEMVQFLQRWFGYALTGDTSEHQFVFVHGPGGNGKTVWLNTVANILGEYHRVAPIDTFTDNGSERHPTDLAALRGARLVSATETEEGRPWAESKIKQLTGGDTIAARFMRQDFFEYQPQFKLTVVGNHKPRLRNVDDAMRRTPELLREPSRLSALDSPCGAVRPRPVSSRMRCLL
jgi:putative DNA primase/helicase